MAYSADLRHKALNYYEQCKTSAKPQQRLTCQEHALPVDSP